MKNEFNNLGKKEYIDMDGNRQNGLNKSGHANEIQGLRKKGYSFEEIKKITNVKFY